MLPRIKLAVRIIIETLQGFNAFLVKNISRLAVASKRKRSGDEFLTVST